MRKIHTVLLVLLITVSCSKNGGTDSTTTTNTPGTGTGTGTSTGTGTGTGTSAGTGTNPTSNFTQSVWQLSGIAIGNNPLTPTSRQSSFVMILYQDSRYIDSDGITGTWSNPTKDSLAINQTNLPTPITVRYKIMAQSISQLVLTQGMGASKIDLTYASK